MKALIESIFALAGAMDRNTAALERSNEIAERDEQTDTVVTMDE